MIWSDVEPSRLEFAEEFVLLFASLEFSVSELGRGIDELELDLLEGSSGDLRDHCLAEGDHSLLCSDDTTLEHEEVFFDDTIMREATHWIDLLLGEIGGGRC